VGEHSFVRPAAVAFAVLAGAAVLLAVPAVRGGWNLTAHPHTAATSFFHGVSTL
jgi:hypothetical protein